jgi:disulfide bond formation protein DsbB
MHNLSKDIVLKIILFISFISLISAYFIEYALGYQPCNLCLIERIPYVLAIILITLSYFFKKKGKFIILLLIMVFFFSFLISFYHLGIEENFFNETAICTLKNTTDIMSKEELLKELQRKTVSCKDVTFRIFGFSLTTLNMIISLIISIFLINIFRKYEKFKE